ncbi:hypothetical protein B4N89_44940 [Embleya scabrispora]|uniref:Uncharacterized protein n=1 Tax=Embleya scabrispora TaxID=159449 RepID=A0A1T3NIM2_9ACTN|nr:hypothetical protein [Embleya scabrispora]OPC76642.1 hypothetical protein B4N89_44940 [Embleya scabrispora]
MLDIGSHLQALALALDEMLPDLTHRQIAAAQRESIAGPSLGSGIWWTNWCAARLADRTAGATWADIGRALGIGADAARHRYGHPRLLWPAPPDSD